MPECNGYIAKDILITYLVMSYFLLCIIHHFYQCHVIAYNHIMSKISLCANVTC